MTMITVMLLSRRNPNGPWMIRNRFGRFGIGHSRDITKAKEAAHVALVGWSLCGIEPTTEFMVVAE
jgi:hypothetical protein